MADSMNSPLALELPLSREALASLRAGDACTLSGAMYTLRDAGHMRLLDELHERGCLPYDLEGATIFYAGPTPPAAGRPFGAVGPTTASRMDFAAPELHRAGIAATVAAMPARCSSGAAKSMRDAVVGPTAPKGRPAAGGVGPA